MVHFLVYEATFSENTLLHGGQHIFTLKRTKKINFCTCIVIAVRTKKPRAEPWKYFSSADHTSILNWFADDVKLHNDSPDYSRMVYWKDFDDKADTFQNAVGEHCKGVQLANFIKNKRSTYMRISKPFSKSGAPAFDVSTLNVEEAEIYNAFHNTIGKNPITRMNRTVRNPTVSKNQFLSLHCELLYIQKCLRHIYFANYVNKTNSRKFKICKIVLFCYIIMLNLENLQT